MGTKKVHEFAVPIGTPTTACRSCKAPIAWVSVGGTATKPGKLMPVSLAAATKNVLGELVGISHFADCPDADKWRRAR